jgi:hypothetical protein
VTAEEPRELRATVTALLAASGLHPSDAEVELLVEVYPQTRRTMEALYKMPGVEGAEPAVVFDARW